MIAPLKAGCLKKSSLELSGILEVLKIEVIRNQDLLKLKSVCSCSDILRVFLKTHCQETEHAMPYSIHKAEQNIILNVTGPTVLPIIGIFLL